MAQFDAGDPRHLLNDAEVKRILARAADLERAGQLDLTVDELRRIAFDAGFSQHAVERAISEAASAAQRAHRAPPTPSARRFWKAAAVAGGLAAAGANVALIADTVDPRGLGMEASVFFMAVTAAFFGVRGLWHRWHGNAVELQLEIASTMAGFTAVITVLQGTDAMQVSLLWWFMCAVGGAGIVRLTVRSLSRDASPS